MRLRRSQAGGVAQAGALFGHYRRDLPLWLWTLFVESFVVFRPGWWSPDRGVAFGRVLGDATARAGESRELDMPGSMFEVWFPSDPIGPGERVLTSSSNRSVLRYVSEQETELRSMPRAWLIGPEPQPLSGRILARIFYPGADPSDAGAGIEARRAALRGMMTP